MSYQKKTTLVLLILLLASAKYDLAAQPASETHSITALEYCDFLNSIPPSAANKSYNEKMGSDPIAGCIIQNKTDFQYAVISGRENFPISYVTKNNFDAYFQWLSDQESSEILSFIIDGIEYSIKPDGISLSKDDDFFACNKTDGIFITSEAISSLAISDLQETYPYLEDAGIAVGIIFVAIVGGKILKTRCWDEESNQKITNVYSFESDFGNLPPNEQALFKGQGPNSNIGGERKTSSGQHQKLILDVISKGSPSVNSARIQNTKKSTNPFDFDYEDSAAKFNSATTETKSSEKELTDSQCFKQFHYSTQEVPPRNMNNNNKGYSQGSMHECGEILLGIQRSENNYNL